MTEKWDRDYLDLAEYWAHKKSKDPSTKVGAIIVRPDRTIASMGYNGFPSGMEDSVERLLNREEKYSRIIHAEINAILNSREPLNGYTLYTVPFMACHRCAVLLIQAGIKRVVSYRNNDPRWVNSFGKSIEYFNECGVDITLYDKETERLVHLSRVAIL